MTARQRNGKAITLHAAMRTESDYQSCASRLKALADPDRLRIVNSLLRGEKSVTGLGDELGMPIDKVSHHLGVLRVAHLVSTQKQGKFVIYSLSPEVAAGNVSAAGTRTIDLGCCQLDLVQLESPRQGTDRGLHKLRR
ncbi:MAG TPA: metalloregulator ArsR/SmtB family transcription factor [Pirellulales bacterium]|jgi:DNA-binding transcriptional ArsR family regulator